MILHFHNNLFVFLGDKATPSTSEPVPKLPHAVAIHRQAETAKQFLEEKGGQPTFYCPCEAPKCCIKQGPVKSSKKLKRAKEVKAKDEDE